MNYYFDTSVITSYYCNDNTTFFAQNALKHIPTAYISMLTEVELHSAIAKKIRTRELTEITAQQVLKQFYTHHKEHHFKKVRILNKYYIEACNWLKLFNSNLRTVDALHLAIAHHNGKILFTLDKDQANAAKKLDINAIYLKEYF